MTITRVPSAVPATAGNLRALPMAFEAIPRPAWDRLLAGAPSATPFSRWTFHRAWWDAYGPTAHEQYLVCLAAGDQSLGTDGRAIRAILPLMHRHEVEPGDHATATVLRRRLSLTSGVHPDAKAIFMAASYHADYATLLADPGDLPAAAAAMVEALAGPMDDGHGAQPWDVVDLRRLRDDDPALGAVEAGFRARAAACGWEVRREREDVCPVITLPGGDWEAYLATLDRKDRHEVRRKLRRAEAAGEVRFALVPLDSRSVEAFIGLHQAKWGAEGLFPPTPGGERSRRFLHRLTELEAAEGASAQLQLGQVSVGDRVVLATVGFDDGDTCFFYNAGMDPEARDLAPGVVGTAAYLRDRMAAGRRRFDFLRGDEAYKYEWGAVDEPIHRLLVTRKV